MAHPHLPPQAASPACTELETVMMDWLGKMLQLPAVFLAGEAGEGGGVIQVRHRGRGSHLWGTWAPGRRTAAGGLEALELPVSSCFFWRMSRAEP